MEQPKRAFTMFVSQGAFDPRQMRVYMATLEFARQAVKDPGRFLLRFPFNLLPARWILSSDAMEVLNNALFAGTSFGGKVIDRDRS